MPNGKRKKRSGPEFREHVYYYSVGRKYIGRHLGKVMAVIPAVVSYRYLDSLTWKRFLEVVGQTLPCAFADQPYAVGKDSDNKHLMDRLLLAILAAESRERFTAFGFTWKATPGGRKR